ncbi:outer membrane protein assembly factor [Ulvibacter antarcticus]|uniref:Calcineurin-like phosphoesterase family protein n=1 Tax=Ulvibacter antarcticus TaxID=442714 RepID=A0A3L9YE02_9FLAO|nr:phosphoesterase [Ulvibacter antarcticus]RMA58936.1 hypothetical protein BXY75_2318 [Ulvibacter antarcticus]
MRIKLLFYIFTILILFSSCATRRIMTSEKLKDASYPSEEMKFERFFIVGNTAKPSEEKGKVLSAMEKYMLSDTSEAKNLIFIGDNVRGSKKNESKIKQQLDNAIGVIKDTKANPFIIPGNYDWDFNGVEGLEIIEDYLDEKLEKENALTPNNGCPLESIEISESVQLIVVDSQWYIENWYLHPEINDKCEIRTREKLFLELEGELKQHANKTIVFAMHHPMFTNGYHGGKFAFKDHIFPLQGNVPLPGIGTLVAEVRSQGGISIQDRFNKRYNELMLKLDVLLNVNDQRIVVVSGHERNLQYIEQGNVKQIVSGAGSKTKPVTLSDNGLFSYGKKGFSILDVFENGSVWVRFFGLDTEDKAKMIFQKEVFKPLPILNLDTLPKSFPKYTEASVYELDKVEKSDFFRSFWGNHYRDVYGKKVKVRTGVLDTLYGGLEVIRPGGGHQTKSLRLETSDGKEYNMRALKKSAVQFLETTAFKGINGEKYFSRTIPEELILDFYTAAHPYGAFAIPGLAKAANVFYTTPELFYIPQQARLGKYNEEYGDQLYMIVEKPSDEYTNRKSFGYPDDIESTDDLLEKLREDEDYTLDEEAYIRARIFDMLIGDWDRHSDQWRWAEFEEDDGKKVFVPIPRDRDQVFANFDGSFLDVLRSMLGAVNQFGVYGEDIVDVKWFNEAGSKLDRALVKRSDRSVWIEQAKNLQKSIDEEIIDKAFAALPKEVQDASVEEIKKKLILRKNNLVNIVERYCDQFAKFQMLTGTDKDDLFEITRMPNGLTRIAAYRIKDGEKGDELFDRTFDSKKTEEIWLYGLDDKDVFEVKGKPDKPILIRIVGGLGKDTYKIEKGRKIKVYDNRGQKNKVEEKGGAHFRFTKLYQANHYDYQRFRKGGGNMGVDVGFNPDDGTLIRASFVKEKNDFILNPYSSKTEIFAEYQFLTQGLDLRLNKYFAAVVSDFNFVVTSRYTSKNYTENFFGFGNETANPDAQLSLDYNRVNMEMYHAGMGLQRISDYGSYFDFKLDVSSVELVKNGDNFVLQTLPKQVGNRSYFLIPNAGYTYKNYDVEEFPSKGMKFNINGGGIDNLGNSNITGFVDASVGFYNSLLSNNRLVLNTHLASKFIIGDTPEFFQQANLGGNTGLRGYRDQRFTGTSSLLGNANIAYNFKKIKTFFFPIGLSVYGGYDIGRVWVESDTSDIWHDSYGGGFLVNWTDALKGNFSSFVSEEGTRLSFGFAFSY